MNNCFEDQNKKVVIKNLFNTDKADREIIGSKIFSKYAVCPNLVKIDTRTVKISLLADFNNTTDNKVLNDLLVDLFVKIKNEFCERILFEFSILKDLEIMSKELSRFSKIKNIIQEICDSIQGKPLYPVHGDIQKENISVSGNKLALIDFEHFRFAPLELDLVNSLFFNDRNCIDVKNLIPKLIKKNLMSIELLFQMLIFYSLKQIKEGRKPSDVQKRLEKAVERLKDITKEDLISKSIPNLIVNRNFDSDWTASTCFA